MKKLGLAAAISALLVGIAFPVYASTSQIISPAGCNHEFSKDKATQNSCTSCVKSGGKFTKARKSNSWSCGR